MKVRITEPGWEFLNGHFGPIEFKDGVSVDDVAPAEATRLANLIRIETLEGENPSITQTVLNSHTLPMAERMVFSQETGSVTTDDELSIEKRAEVTKLGREDLVAVADAEGIAGLRKIADPLGIKGKSIAELIDAILIAQSPKKAEPVEPVVEPEPEVSAPVEDEQPTE